MRVSKRYLTLFILILVTEVAIAVFHFHRFVRGFLGDVLVVPLMYTFLRALFTFSWKTALHLTFFFAVAVELIQWSQITTHLGVRNKIVDLVLGNTFDPWDLLAYTVGYLAILLIELKNQKHE